MGLTMVSRIYETQKRAIQGPYLLEWGFGLYYGMTFLEQPNANYCNCSGHRRTYEKGLSFIVALALFRVATAAHSSAGSLLQISSPAGPEGSADKIGADRLQQPSGTLQILNSTARGFAGATIGLIICMLFRNTCFRRLRQFMEKQLVAEVWANS